MSIDIKHLVGDEKFLKNMKEFNYAYSKASLSVKHLTSCKPPIKPARNSFLNNNYNCFKMHKSVLHASKGNRKTSTHEMQLFFPPHLRALRNKQGACEQQQKRCIAKKDFTSHFHPKLTMAQQIIIAKICNDTSYCNQSELEPAMAMEGMLAPAPYGALKNDSIARKKNPSIKQRNKIETQNKKTFHSPRT